MSLNQWFGLSGKQALVTGASRGLGRSMALALAEAGADVIITGRNAGPLEQTAAEIAAKGRKANLFVADMSDAASTQDACAEILKSFGPVDILINNIGNRLSSDPIETEPLATWEAMLGFNISTTYAATQVIGRDMIARGLGGRIINIASIAGLRPIPDIGGRYYEIGKSAVLQLTRCTALDWGRHGINTNAICPGLFMTDTNLSWQQKNPAVIDTLVRDIPLGRPGHPDEIGPLAVFLASPAAAFTNGAHFVIDGGASV
jgi:NAD(P)-dependent dehydrogenase (short-subunit alcohol dehydrogenase family)